MKLSLLLPLLLALAPVSLLASEITLTPPENSRLAGRIHFVREPGGGTGSMKLMDQFFPNREVRVGPTERTGTGLALLLGIHITDEARAALDQGAKAELVLTVRGASLGGSPSPLKVVLLETFAFEGAESFSWFGAWNNANSLTELGTIPGDPDLGPHRFDATAALSAAPRTAKARPMVFFAIHGSFDDLVDMNRGRHVLFGGTGDEMPRLVITPKQ